MPTIQQITFPLFAALAPANAHMQPTRRDPAPRHSRENCTCIPGSRPAESYHIHVMFYPPDAPNVNPDDPAGNSPNNAQEAAALRTAFIEHFNIAECEEHVQGARADPTELCAFAVDPATGGQPFPAAQPFTTPEFAFFVPLDRWVDAVPWMMLNRGVFDVLVHPNTCGWQCAPQDHLLSSLWMGRPWPVKFRLPESRQGGPPLPQQHASPKQHASPPTPASPATSRHSARAVEDIALALCCTLMLLGLLAWTQRARRRNSEDGAGHGMRLALEGCSLPRR